MHKEASNNIEVRDDLDGTGSQTLKKLKDLSIPNESDAIN